jgi:hypothetical protein
MIITKHRLLQIIREEITRSSDTGDTGDPADRVREITDMGWVSWGSFAILPYDQVMSLRELPLRGSTPQEKLEDYRGWRLSELIPHTIGEDAGNVQAYGSSLSIWNKHPEIKKPMLPPQWTLAMTAMIEKVDAVVGMGDEEREEYARSQGLLHGLAEIDEIIRELSRDVYHKYF